jgi:hypothetical protein
MPQTTGGAHSQKGALKMTEKSYAYEQAAAQMASISSMVSALAVDYGRLDDLREERDDLSEAVKDAQESLQMAVDGCDPAGVAEQTAALAAAEAALSAWAEENEAELAELEDAAGGCENEDEARRAIDDDPLSVEVRSGWHSLGETLQPAEFQILLCAGGPAVRILGELDGDNQPCRAWLEYQDWGTPWTEYHGENADQAVLLSYAGNFYFGE